MTPEPEGLYIRAEKSGPIDVKEKVQLEALTNDPAISLKKLKWASSNKKVATVSGKGLVTGKGDGTTTITVTTADKHSASIEIAVKDRSQPEQIAIIEPAVRVIGLKEKLAFAVDLGGADAKKAKLKWTTSDKKVAAVSAKGVVTGKSAGKAVITVTAKNGLNASFEIEVRDIHAPTSVSIEPAGPLTVGVKGKLTLTAMMTAEGEPKTKLKWASSNKKVAAVSNKGVVTGKSAGTATITVTTANKLSASVDITVQ